jgi:hypothetical protein
MQLHGSDRWTIAKGYKQTLQTAETRVLRSVKGHTRVDEIRKEDTEK